MTPSSDAYWDELGVAWCAMNPEASVIKPRLRSRLRRQSFVIAASLGLGLPLSLAGFILGGFTIWSGWDSGTWNFVTRGIAIVAISAILSGAVFLLVPIRASGDAKALSDMIDLSIARAARSLLIVRLGFYACAIAAVLGLIGTAIRSYLSHPPAMSPIINLAVLALFALGLALYGRHVRRELSKFQHLKHVLAVDAA